MKPVIVIAIALVFVLGIGLGFSLNVSAEEGLIPSWIKSTASFWVDGQIGDSEFISALQYLVKEGILTIPEEEQKQIDPPSLELDAGPDDDSDITQSGVMCSGNARCIIGTVTSVIDGDTIKVDGQSIRFALASAPELNESGGIEARNFIETICSVGSVATVDEDDGQTQGSYGRILGVVYCNGFNLNQDLLDVGHGYLISSFCNDSEFTTEYWAQKHGCDSKSETVTPTITEKNCDSSYPDVCIAPYPPDLDCGDIPYKDFKVLRPDPHGFDGDYDGIGCETYNP
jgi:micrococcal nuclease